jgi:SAM-dependent methyltransferase
VLRELGLFVRSAPGALALKARLSQAELYDVLIGRMDDAGLAARRDALVGDLDGRVLEVGAGTGLDFARYPATARVTALEPDPAFAARATARAAAAAAAIELVDGRGEALPFADASFDAVVFGLVLCSVGDVGAVLAEAHRVLRPGGALRLLEHVRSDRPVAGALMVAVNPLWRLLNGQGCNLHRRPLPAIEAAGFVVEEVERFQVFAEGIPAFPMQLIRARKPHG